MSKVKDTLEMLKGIKGNTNFRVWIVEEDKIEENITVTKRMKMLKNKAIKFNNVNVVDNIYNEREVKGGVMNAIDIKGIGKYDNVYVIYII